LYNFININLTRPQFFAMLCIYHAMADSMFSYELDGMSKWGKTAAEHTDFQDQQHYVMRNQ